MGVQFDRAGLLRQVAARINPRAGSCRGAGVSPDGTAVCRSPWCLATARWIAGLPALGNVLYVTSGVHGAMQGRPLPGLLVESIELAPLLHTRTLAAASAITADGPREWIECRSAGDQVLARLYLLPDTDYLAWDALRAAAVDGRGGATRAETAVWQPTAARLLRLRVRCFAGLQWLGADAGIATSSLGRELAARIARDGALLR